MASLTLGGIEFASCHARHSAGTADRVIAEALWPATRMASGNGDGARISGMPCNSSGNTRFEKPYECAIEITPRFGQSARRPIVATMLSASAAICFAVKATRREAPPVADVVLR